MMYLILAICSSVAISLLLRVSKEAVSNQMVMFLANYTACSCIALGYMGSGTFQSGAGMPFAAGLGVLSGSLLLGSFFLLQSNIRKNGVVMAALFMKLGVLVPTVMAILFFREKPGAVQLLGFLLALGAICLMQMEKGEGQNRLHWSLLVLLLAGGLADSFVNIYDKMGNPEWKNHFLFFSFFSAGIFSLIIAILERKPFTYKDFLWGLMIGIPNYYSSRFLLLSLQTIPAVAAYPIYNVASMVMISIFGAVAFRETLSLQKKIGIGVVLVSLVLLNVS